MDLVTLTIYNGHRMMYLFGHDLSIGTEDEIKKMLIL